MNSAASLPLVGVPTNQIDELGRSLNAAPNTISEALFKVAGVLPVLLPALDEAALPGWLSRLDGLLLCGGDSHVEPHHYGANYELPRCAVDPVRDALTLNAIRHARVRRLPLFGICRGMQEINVACGGTLVHDVHATAGKMDHRSDKALHTLPERLEKPAHAVAVQAGGVFEQWFGAGDLTVNSLHDQAVGEVAQSLRVEAVAPDGVIEAISDPAHPFMLGVQWHPEWRTAENNVSRKLFEEFGKAVRAYAAMRT